MTSSKSKDFTGYSQSSIHEAVSNALEKAGQDNAVEIIETRSSQGGGKEPQYQVTITKLEPVINSTRAC